MVAARFEVSNIVRVPPGRARQLRATFDLTIAGVGLIRACRYLVDGKRRFVLGPSLQDTYRGWFQVVFFEDEVAEEILRGFDAVEAEAAIDRALASERERE